MASDPLASPPIMPITSQLIVNVASAIGRIGMALILWPYRLLSGSEPQKTTSRRARFGPVIWQLERAFDEIVTHAPDGKVFKGLSDFADALTDVSREFLHWLSLVEDLVQEAEREFGRRPGFGKLKEARVRAALIYLLHRERISEFFGTSLLTPWLVDEVLSLIIKPLIFLLNRPVGPKKNLWQTQEQLGVESGYLMGKSRSWLFTFLDWPGRLLMRIAWWLVFRCNPVTPKMKEIVESRQGEVRDTLQKTWKLVTWVASNREFLEGLLEIISIATLEAELFVEKSGKEKQAYARDLILTFLERREYLSGDNALEHLFVSVLIDFAIDSIVFIFNKREVFPAPKRGLFPQQETKLAEV